MSETASQMLVKCGMDYTSFAPGASSKPNIPPKLMPSQPPQDPKHIHHFAAKIILLILIGVGVVGGLWWWNQMQTADDAQDIVTFTPRVLPQSSAIVYRNDQYGFEINLPQTWKGFSVTPYQWQGRDVASGEVTQVGPEIILRNPAWTSANPTEDMPVLIFTSSQWNQIQQEKLSISAAPIPPSLLGQNSKYAMALPARYNYDYKTDWQEVDQLVHTLKAFEPGTSAVSPTPTAMFCGGIAGTVCPSGYTCKYDGNYPDASGSCVKK